MYNHVTNGVCCFPSLYKIVRSAAAVSRYIFPFLFGFGLYSCVYGALSPSPLLLLLCMDFGMAWLVFGRQSFIPKLYSHVAFSFHSTRFSMRLWVSASRLVFFYFAFSGFHFNFSVRAHCSGHIHTHTHKRGVFYFRWCSGSHFYSIGVRIECRKYTVRRRRRQRRWRRHTKNAHAEDEMERSGEIARRHLISVVGCRLWVESKIEREIGVRFAHNCLRAPGWMSLPRLAGKCSTNEMMSFSSFFTFFAFCE